MEPSVLLHTLQIDIFLTWTLPLLTCDKLVCRIGWIICSLGWNVRLLSQPSRISGTATRELGGWLMLSLMSRDPCEVTDEACHSQSKEVVRWSVTEVGRDTILQGWLEYLRVHPERQQFTRSQRAYLQKTQGFMSLLWFRSAYSTTVRCMWSLASLGWFCRRAPFFLYEHVHN